LISQTDAAHSFDHHWPVEIQNQSDSQPCDPQIRQHLSQEYGVETFDAFDFDDDLFVDDKVRPVLGDQLSAPLRLVIMSVSEVC
jgi:hypothetical protein